MEMPVQVKLLRVLESRDLGAEIGAGRFREDLYYRLYADLIRTPGLAEQVEVSPEVLGELVYFMTRRAAGEEAEAAFRAVVDWITSSLPANYAWPGNYRELEQCVRNVLIRGSYRPLMARRADAFGPRAEPGELTADALMRGYAGRVYAECGSFVETAKRLGVDRRTVRGWVEE
jgi:DNA-binding NtrC family response regulator